LRLVYLVVKDFGPYRGSHRIDLTGVEDSTAFAFFGAKNGRGKTSLYNAMRWCLFGEVVERAKPVSGQAVSGGKRPIVGSPPQKFLMNAVCLENDKKQEMQVMLFAKRDGEDIQVTRTATSNTTLPRDDSELTILTEVSTGGNRYENRDAEEKIESFFPRELERFFFIDGEALEEYTAMMAQSSVGGLKDEIRSILRLPALTRGVDDISTIKRNIGGQISRQKKAGRAASGSKKMALEKRKELQKVQSEIDDFHRRIRTTDETLEQITDKLQENSELRVHIDNAKNLQIRIDEKKKFLKRTHEDLVEESKEAWKVLLWKKAESMYEETQNQLETITNSSSQAKILSKQLEKREIELTEFSGICVECEQPLPNLEKHKEKLTNQVKELKEQIKELQSTAGLNQDELRDRESRLRKFKPNSGSQRRILNQNKRWMEEKEHLEQMNEELSGLNDRLKDSNVEEAEALITRKGELDQLRRELVNKQRESESKARALELETNKLERAGKGSAIDRFSVNIENTLGRLIVTIENTIRLYTEKAREEVEKASTNVFMEVTNAPETFSGIKLDKDFRASIRLRKGGVATSPSSGMESMMTISIIDGLRQVSGLKAPIFFDTPGRSLDEEHKNLMLEYFWRDHGQQFFIFAHSGEFKLEETIEKYRDRIGRAWTLTWPEDNEFCPECKSTNRIQLKKKSDWRCLDCSNEWDTSEPHTVITQLEI